MSLRSIILMVTISIGGAIGWRCGSFGGIMGSYLASIVGSAQAFAARRSFKTVKQGQSPMTLGTVPNAARHNG